MESTSRNNTIYITSEIFTLLPSSYLEELAGLDITCKFILQKHCDGCSSDYGLLKIQSVLDLMYETINIGDWKQVKSCFRKTITVASYLKLLHYLKENESALSAENIQNVFNIIDHGLLFGSPLHSEPKLLQKCATILNNIIPCTFETKMEEQSINIKNNNIPMYENAIIIESVDCPSMEYFYTQCILKQQPVILNNCINHWPALSKWKDQSYLLQCAGLRMVPVEVGSKYTDNEWTQKLMTMGDFIENHIFNTKNTVGYLAQYQLFNQIPELMEDISVPEYCCFSESEENVEINAWYGPKGTVSPLHYDPKNNLLAQIVGEKKVFLFSPSDSDFLYPYEEELLSNTARIDPRTPDIEIYPNYNKATPYFCILKPGQLLFIPPKWWHFVESLSISFSVSFWWEFANPFLLNKE